MGFSSRRTSHHVRPRPLRPRCRHCVLGHRGAGPRPPSRYPNRPIRLIVAFPPGGATDVIARVVGQPLGQRLGQPVVVENRPGSNGNIAAEVAAKAKPDGYTLLLGSDSLFGINPHLYAKMPIDPPRTSCRSRTWCRTSSCWRSIRRRCRSTISRTSSTSRKRAKPPLFYASIGNGSQHHLAMEMLKQAAGIDLTHVPYKGGGPAGIAVMSGEVAGMFGGGSVRAAGQIRQAARRSRSSGAQALAGAARPAVDLRDLSRLRGDALAGPVRAGRHAAGDHRQAAHGSERGAGDARRRAKARSPPARASPTSRRRTSSPP